jgi:sulfoxide reductase catalytic subunit YedY
MVIKKQNFESDIHWYDITDKDLYINRRKFIKGLGKLSVVTALALFAPPFLTTGYARNKHRKLEDIEKSTYSTDESPHKYKDVTSYNNFYEFGLDKTDPALYARKFKARPWTVAVDGHVRNPGEYDVDKIIKRHQLEERIYRMRCVEAWSMIIPWIGIPLATFIGEMEPTSQAKYVKFTTLYDPEQMPGQKSSNLDWPYVEGLRMDEAMHPLTILAVGIYGEVLPNQNGAPIRLIVPWKYGFKSVKSIVRISFVEDQPKTTWSIAAPREYGFFANVNPEVDHPRWSQKTEQAIGKYGRKPTVLFNGYGKYVEDMYSDIDLSQYY